MLEGKAYVRIQSVEISLSIMSLPNLCTVRKQATLPNAALPKPSYRSNTHPIKPHHAAAVEFHKS